MPESRLIVATMMDLQNPSWWELGKEGGEGGGERFFFFSPSLPFAFPFSLIPTPPGCTFYFPQSSSAFKIRDGGFSVTFARPKTTLVLQASNL